jgi:hypothetical protein
VGTDKEKTERRRTREAAWRRKNRKERERGSQLGFGIDGVRLRELVASNGDRGVVCAT